MRQRNFLRLGAGDAIGGALAACSDTMAPARPSSVLGWNRLALQTAAAAGAPSATRALAILHTCMYNAWAAYDDDARQTVHGVAVRLPHAERSAASKTSAMSHAAWLVLGTLFPSQTAALDACMAGLGLDPGRAAGQFSPAGIGCIQAFGMLDAWRDGSVLPFAPAQVQAPGPADVDTAVDAAAHAAADAAVEATTLRWCRLAHEVSARDACDDDRDVLLYFVLANALADAVLAGADPGAAAAEVLRSFTGSDRAGGVNGTIAAGFSAIAAQDGSARTHEARMAGRDIGAQVFDKARRYWQGKL